MAFTRAEVRAILGDAHTDEMENRLIALHLGVADKLKDELDTIKTERDRFKAEAEKLPGVQQELDALKGGEDYKTRWEQEKQAFADYKAEVARNEELAKIKTAYSTLLTDEQINEKHIKDVLRLTDFSKMKLDKDGNLENPDTLRKAINDEWSEYKVVTTKRTPKVDTPPTSGTGSGMSRARELALKYQQEKYGVKPTGKE